jgi:hypothetical protein
VSTELQVQRSNITVQGISNSPSSVVLQRAVDMPHIMSIASGLVGVTVQYLTFDGNRQNVAGGSLNCLPVSQTLYWDLDMPGVGRAVVQYDDFINSPGTAISVYTTVPEVLPDGTEHGSVVQYCNFGAGFGSESAQQTGARTTAIIVYGTATQVIGNLIAYAGTAAINLYSDTNQLVYENILDANRYEQPDGVSGGQLYISAGVTNATIAENSINGDYWMTTGTSTSANGCSLTPGLFPLGVEGFGSGHAFLNNWITQNLYGGMLLREVSGITISGNDSLCPTCTAQYIENNGGCYDGLPSNEKCMQGWPSYIRPAGININNENGSGFATNIAFDMVRVRSNGHWGLNLTGVTGGPGFEGTQCIYNNLTNNLNVSNSSSVYGSYTEASPSSCQ